MHHQHYKEQENIIQKHYKFLPMTAIFVCHDRDLQPMDNDLYNMFAQVQIDRLLKKMQCLNTILCII